MSIGRKAEVKFLSFLFFRTSFCVSTRETKKRGSLCFGFGEKSYSQSGRNYNRTPDCHFWTQLAVQTHLL